MIRMRIYPPTIRPPVRPSEFTRQKTDKLVSKELRAFLNFLYISWLKPNYLDAIKQFFLCSLALRERRMCGWMDTDRRIIWGCELSDHTRTHTLLIDKKNLLFSLLAE